MSWISMSLPLPYLITLSPEYILSIRHGYSVKPRRPLLPLDEEAGKHFLAKLQPVLAIEDRLKKGSSDVVAS